MLPSFSLVMNLFRMKTVYIERNLKSVLSDFQQNKADLRNKAHLSKNGKFHNSIAKPTIFKIEPSHVALIPLHISLGLGLKFFDQLEAKCQEIDRDAALNNDPAVTDEDSCPLVKELNRSLEEQFHVKKQAYHSNSFVCNHIAKIFLDPQIITSVLHEYPDEHKICLELFTRFSVLPFFLMMKSLNTVTHVGILVPGIHAPSQTKTSHVNYTF